jgi:hypothetical protein
LVFSLSAENEDFESKNYMGEESEMQMIYLVEVGLKAQNAI